MLDRPNMAEAGWGFRPVPRPAFSSRRDMLGFASGVSGPRGLEISTRLSNGAGAVRCFPGAYSLWRLDRLRE